MNGVIIKGVGGLYQIRSDGGIIECRARGIFRKKNIKPMIGDRVIIENGSISDIEKRKNFLIRPPVANVDNLVIVVAAQSPGPDFLLIDKMIINAELVGIKPIICINKTDLADGKEICKIYQSAGYPVIEVSAKENHGIEELFPYLKGKTTAFTGLSGVGKSSILNIITGKKMQTGEISEKIQRGRHTTRHVELIELEPGTFVLDTPGFGTLEVTGLKASELEEYFQEFPKDECRFRACSHISEPDCAVKAELDKGVITESRYKSYSVLYSALKQIKEWEQE